jgi:hypothetical protein
VEATRRINNTLRKPTTTPTKIALLFRIGISNFFGRERKSSTYEKNIENRIHRHSPHDGLHVAAALRDSAEIRKFRHKNHSDHIDTDFPDCIIQSVY